MLSSTEQLVPMLSSVEQLIPILSSTEQLIDMLSFVEQLIPMLSSINEFKSTPWLVCSSHDLELDWNWSSGTGWTIFHQTLFSPYQQYSFWSTDSSFFCNSIST